MSKQYLIMLFCLFAGILKVSAQPHFITKQPVSQTICQSQNGVTFSVEVDLNGPYYYQWYRQQVGTANWESIPGFIYPTCNAEIAGKYYCVVTKSTESEQSNIVTLTINNTPYIKGFDIPSVCNGSELKVHVNPADISSNGSAISGYEWRLVDPQGVQTTITQSGTGSTISDFRIAAAVPEQSGMVLTLDLTNGCGTTTSAPPRPIVVWATPLMPVPVVNNYCQGEKAPPLTITSNNPAVWYNAATGGQVIPTPTPNTNAVGVQKWWVSQKVIYPNDGPTCESDRSEAVVEVYALPANPVTTANIELCLYDPDITLSATGTDYIQWYDGQQKTLPSAPQINTSTAGTQIYYVTQDNGKCESPIEKGKVTILIRNRSVVDAIDLLYDSELCPNNSTVLVVTSQRPNPIFRWYKNEDKTEFIPPAGPTLTTPVLMRDTVYYVTVQFESAGECESIHPKAAVINVGDLILPKITAPPRIIISTDDGACFATNVQTGRPLVSDNCTFEENILVFTNPVAPTIYAVGDTTLIWWAQDEIGNKDYALQAVSVRDREKPKGICPEKIEWEIDENENSAIVFYSMSYTDNCGEVKDTLVRGLTSGAVFPLGETLVRHLVSDKAGNIDTCEFKVIVKHPWRPIQVDLRVSAYEICEGQEVVITPIISGGSGRYNYSWKPRAWSDAVMRDYPLTNTHYEVIINDGVSPPITKSVQITVLPTKPVILTLEGRPQNQIFEGDEVLVTATSGFPNYKLLLNNQEVQPSGLNNKVGFQAELGKYFVRVFATDESGCVSQDQIEIEVKCEDLPNVFTPHQKNHSNQIFLEFLENPQSPEDFHLQIFTRAGELLYQGNKGWDGYYKGKLMQQGTYLYVVRRKMNNGEYWTFKGVVTLKL